MNAVFSELGVGAKLLVCKGAPSCLAEGEVLVIYEEEMGLCVHCRSGNHYLAAQIDGALKDFSRADAIVHVDASHIAAKLAPIEYAVLLNRSACYIMDYSRMRPETLVIPVLTLPVKEVGDYGVLEGFDGLVVQPIAIDLAQKNEWVKLCLLDFDAVCVMDETCP